MMKKDFDAWNLEKKIIERDVKNVFCHPREIWWCSLGVNVGFEQDGTGKNFDRPVVVVRRFNEKIFLGAALIGRRKEGEHYFPVGLVEDKEASVVLSQIRLIDTKRLIKKIGVLDEQL